jgi:spore maturation protein CgeB
MNWWMRGRRPTRLNAFSERVVATCRAEQPDFLVATGIAPIEKAALEQIGKLGIQRLNYLTDDPWNRSHRAPWFMDAIRQYDHVFSTRRSNLDDLRQHGCKAVTYLPFAYAPELHYRELPAGSDESSRFSADVAFAGGADSDRVIYVRALIQQGFRVAVYGGYWHRYADTKAHARGHADPATLRKAVAGAKVALGLVRRANRDGNSMRTFELAAMGACILAEYTEEHRDILGADGDAVVYFRTPGEMVSRLRWLLDNQEERERLSAAARCRIISTPHTYRDRLDTMLSAATPRARQ